MPGAFTHITTVNQVLSEPFFHKQLPSQARRILTMNQFFYEFGAIAPDFPYMAIGNKPQSQWADLMHSCHVDMLLKGMIDYLKTLSGKEFEVGFAWVSGYLSHVVADITIHPVIELKVGNYSNNKTQHRICEMHQDAFIWKYMGIGDIGLKERVSRSLNYCADTNNPDKLDRVLSDIWSVGLLNIPLIQPVEIPDLNLWYQSFKRMISLVEDEYKLFPFSRHVAAFLGLKYPTTDQVDSKYLYQLPTPAGNMDYELIFQLCIEQVILYTELLWRSVTEDYPVDWVCNWNLDTGYTDSGEITIWDSFKTRQKLRVGV